MKIRQVLIMLGVAVGGVAIVVAALGLEHAGARPEDPMTWFRVYLDSIARASYRSINELNRLHPDTPSVVVEVHIDGLGLSPAQRDRAAQLLLGRYRQRFGWITFYPAAGAAPSNVAGRLRVRVWHDRQSQLVRVETIREDDTGRPQQSTSIGPPPRRMAVQ